MLKVPKHTATSEQLIGIQQYILMTSHQPSIINCLGEKKYLHLELALVHSQESSHRPRHIHRRHEAPQIAVVQRTQGCVCADLLALLNCRRRGSLIARTSNVVRYEMQIEILKYLARTKLRINDRNNNVA